MIDPQIGELDWAPRLQDAQTWVPGDAPMVVIAPHPDDETLAAGGLIARQVSRGVSVTVVAVTDGENAYQHNHGLAAIRREEQQQALQVLGLHADSIVRLGLTDSGLHTQEEQLVGRLRPLVIPGCQVVAPWRGDFHPDHEACARAASILATEADAELISYFFWTWHRGTLATIADLTLSKVPLSEAAQAAKRAALECHDSQLRHSPEPEILPANLLWPARLPFEVFAR